MKPCSRCGGPMARKEVRGFEVEACVRCGAVLMDSAALEIIAAGGEDVRTPVPASSATPSAPEPRWVHKSADAPKPLYKNKAISQSVPPVQDPGPSERDPAEAEETEEAPKPVTPPPTTPRGAGPRRRTPAPPPVAPTPKPPGSPPPIYRATQRPGSSPTLMPEVYEAPSEIAGEPGLGNLSSALGARTGPGLLGDVESTEEVAKTTIDNRQPVAQMTTAPRPPNRAPAPFDDPDLTEWTRRRQRTRKTLMTVAILTWVGIFAAIAVVGYLAWSRGTLREVGLGGPEVTSTAPASVEPEPNDTIAPEVDDLPQAPPQAEQAAPPAVVAPEPVAPEPVAPEPVAPEPVAPEPVAPEPTAPEPTAPEPATPAPSPRPAPAPTSAASLIDRGWSQVERDPVAAGASFDRAMAQNAGDPEANYGYGYALIRQGNPAAASFYLCRSLAGASTETRREVSALLERNNLSCD